MLSYVGSYVPLNPARMRNMWFPMRKADYVSTTQLKQLKAQGVPMARDGDFGVFQALQEEPEDLGGMMQQKTYVRPIEVDLLSVRLPAFSRFWDGVY